MLIYREVIKGDRENLLRNSEKINNELYQRFLKIFDTEPSEASAQLVISQCVPYTKSIIS